ncbi:MAG: RIP metalloprotease RseP [Candidatus Cloacimonas sp.]|nr:RIP metalloprotease RseP [Candidatus Cloacimonadota bacterium]
MFIIGVLIAIGILVLVHESGHFLAARFFGITVEKFSIGFGPHLFSFQKGDTKFSISLIPLGGYVKMKGDEPEDGNSYENNDFFGQSWWKRVIVVFAGPFANLLLALLLFVFSFGLGRNIEDHYPIIGKVEPLYDNYFHPKDKIINLNGVDITHWGQLSQETKQKTINTFTIEREDSIIVIEIPEIEADIWWGKIMPDVPAIIGSVSPGMPAYRTGLQVGDQIIAVDKESVEDWYEMREKIASYPEDSVNLTLLREGREFDLLLPLEANLLEDEQQKMIGITQYMPVKLNVKYGLMESVKYSAISTANFIAINYYALFKIISKPLSAKEHIGGPVMIVTMSHQTAQMGFGAVLAFMASISLVLMIMNLLPIPVLDGGHIFFFFLEGIFKKPLPIRVQNVIQQIGFFFLMLLMVFAFYNDISKLVGRNIAKKLQRNQVEQVN